MQRSGATKRLAPWYTPNGMPHGKPIGANISQKQPILPFYLSHFPLGVCPRQTSFSCFYFWKVTPHKNFSYFFTCLLFYFPIFAKNNYMSDFINIVEKILKKCLLWLSLLLLIFLIGGIFFTLIGAVLHDYGIIN